MLNSRELRFAQEYVSHDAAEAAKRAGYDDYEQAAERLICNPEIIEAVRKIEEVFIEECGKALANRYMAELSFLDNMLYKVIDSSNDDRLIVKAIEIGYRALRIG